MGIFNNVLGVSTKKPIGVRTKCNTSDADKPNLLSIIRKGKRLPDEVTPDSLSELTGSSPAAMYPLYEHMLEHNYPDTYDLWINDTDSGKSYCHSAALEVSEYPSKLYWQMMLSGLKTFLTEEGLSSIASTIETGDEESE